MKLSQWFDGGKFVPAHVGVYECRDGLYRFWNGEFWGAYGRTVDIAAIWSHVKSFQQNLYWRGLSENPNDDQKV